jgi:hypothetical protein
MQGQPGQFGLRGQPPPYDAQRQPGPYAEQGQPGAGVGQGAPTSAGYPPPSGQRGPIGYSGPGGFAAPAGAGGAQGWKGDHGPGGPGWQPPGGPGQSGYRDYGYPAPDGYGQTVNGGEYAYVISDDAPRAGHPAKPRGPQQPPAAAPRRRTREERMQARPTGATRSITAGRADAARAGSPPANAGTSGAYGPDDPAYGPPVPGWSHEDRPVGGFRGPAQPGGVEGAAAAGPGEAPNKAEQITPEPVAGGQLRAGQFKAEPVRAEPVRAEQDRAEQDRAEQAEPEQAVTPPPAAPDRPAVRGPFEPLVEHNGQASAAASLPAADHPGTDADGRPYEFPGLDDDEPAGSADAALDRLKELHRTAAAVAPQSLDAHFDQLLERQRRLISEYITESEGPPTVGDASGDDSLVGFGGDFRGTR